MSTSDDLQAGTPINGPNGARWTVVDPADHTGPDDRGYVKLETQDDADLWIESEQFDAMRENSENDNDVKDVQADDGRIVVYTTDPADTTPADTEEWIASDTIV